MAKKLKIKSKSKEEAIKKALLELNVSEDDIEVEELEAPSKGFLGFIESRVSPLLPIKQAASSPFIFTFIRLSSCLTSTSAFTFAFYKSKYKR